MWKRFDLKPVAILIYVEDTEKGFAWYQKALPDAKVRYFSEKIFLYWSLNVYR